VVEPQLLNIEAVTMKRKKPSILGGTRGLILIRNVVWFKLWIVVLWGCGLFKAITTV
jgi:hypothetical protein